MDGYLDIEDFTQILTEPLGYMVFLSWSLSIRIDTYCII